MPSSTHHHIYQYAKYYAIAFNFRNIPEECHFFETVFQAYTQRKIESFLELAAGPAFHALEFAKRSCKSYALDLSPEMVAYGQEQAQKEQVSLKYHCGNMIHFSQEEPVDLVALLMDSASYLLDNESAYDHLRSVSLALKPGGLYILEMSHPRDVFFQKKSSETSWSTTQDHTTVHFQWGFPHDVFDPITQILPVTVRLAYEEGKHSGELIQKASQRMFTCNEWKALVYGSACFEPIAFYGALNSQIPFNNEKQAWRMVSVLQKKK
jgi:SAM-dependent methyltransferase